MRRCSLAADRPAPFRLLELGGLVAHWALPANDGGCSPAATTIPPAASGKALLELAKPAKEVLFEDFLGHKLGTAERVAETVWSLPYQPYQILTCMCGEHPVSGGRHACLPLG